MHLRTNNFFLDPRFSKTLVFVELGFKKYRPRFNKQLNILLFNLQTYPKPRVYFLIIPALVINCCFESYMGTSLFSRF